MARISSSTQLGSSKALRAFSLSAPFFLPAILFQSGVFAFLTPLPLLMLSAVSPPLVWLAALLTNSALISLTLGWKWVGLALPIWLGLGLSFRLFLRQKVGIYLAFAGSILVAVLGYGIAGLLAQIVFKLDLTLIVRTEIAFVIQEALKLPDSWLKPLVEQQGREALESRILFELPGVLVMFLVFSQVTSLWMLSRRVKGFLSPSFWGSIRLPFALVWIAIALGATWVLGAGQTQWLAESGIRVLAMLFAIQGISALTTILARFKLRPLSRWAALTLIFVLAPPFVVSLGFFDQWFDFRRKVAP